jgi:hypothetical protein
MGVANPAALAPIVVWGAFVLAFIFGAVANRTNFCTMGAVSDIVNMGDWTRMRMWLLAIAIAVLGTAALQLSGKIDVAKTIYTTSNFTWLSYVVGGFVFGVGMTLGSGCGSKTLIRLGGGNLKSFIVFVMLAISAYMTLKGLFGVFRAAAIDPVAIGFASAQDLPTLLGKALGADRRTLLAAIALVLGVGLIGFVFASRDFRSFDNILGGVVLGLVVVAGWYLSGTVGYIAEDPSTLEEKFVATSSGRMESMSFVAPQAYLLELLLLWSDKSRVLTFGIATVLGMIAGSAAYAIATRSFRLESFRDSQDLIAHIAGGVLMGFGGVLGMGCTIGQGLTGISTLALGSFVTFFAIVAGAATTMKVQYWRIMKET